MTPRTPWNVEPAGSGTGKELSSLFVDCDLVAVHDERRRRDHRYSHFDNRES